MKFNLYKIPLYILTCASFIACKKDNTTAPVTPPVTTIDTTSVISTKWWNDAVFYEVFVRSFYDQDGDGNGDLKGLTQKLDYLNDGNAATKTDLGVTAIWLMPVMQSPSYHGYDVTDYRTIEADYGSNNDFKTFIAAAHSRGIKVIIDYVMNHTSDQNPWFIQSAAGTGTYRNWYRWSASNPGGMGPWGQTVWYNRNGSYYYALFWSGMPDLNYETPAVKTEMFDIARFWLQDMGVDGFRLDAVKYIFETATQLEDVDATFNFWHDFRTFYKSVNPDAMTVGEAWTATNKVVKYVQNDRLDLCFEFDLAGALVAAVNSGDPSALRGKIAEVVSSYPGLQYGTFLTNHDMARVMTSFANDDARAKLAAELLLTLPGVPFIYYGEEIGTTGDKPDENIRTPLQWTGGTNAGFTTGTPWRAPQANYTTRNIEAQQADNNSLWNVYREMIAVRENEITLRRGYYYSLSANNASAFTFLRKYKSQAVIVAANLGGTALSNVTISLGAGKLLPGNYTLEDQLTGTIHDIVIASDGGFNEQSIGALAARTTAIYKLIKK